MSLFDRNEWLADQADAENRYEAYMSKIVKGNWTCKDGSLINVEDMDTEHIKNCIKMLKTKEYGRPWIERFEVELNRRSRFKRDLKRALEELREEDELPEFEPDDWGD